MDNDDWKKEDPNLLNNPKLLYQEAAKLSLPSAKDAEKQKEIWNVMKMIRELILDHSVVFDTLSQHNKIRGTEEQALKVITGFMEAFQSKVHKCGESSARLQSMEMWNPENIREIFSKQGSDKILLWKTTLNQFLECFSNIRKFIPKEALEQAPNAEAVEMEKKQLSCLPEIHEELERLNNILESFMDI